MYDEDEEEDDDLGVVIDMGSRNCRVGFSGDEYPKICVTPDSWRRYVQGSGSNRIHGTTDTRDCLSDVYPVQRGIVTDVDAMGDFYEYMFEDLLHLVPGGKEVFLSEPVLNPKGSKECKAQLLYEKMGVQSTLFYCEGVLPFYSKGFTEGVNVMVGDGLTTVTPLCDGRIINACIRRMDFGGQDLTQYLQKLLLRKGYSFNTQDEMEYVRRAKENLCFVSDIPLLSRKEELLVDSTVDKRMELIDGTYIKLGQESVQCAEVLFNPALIGSSLPSIQEVVKESLMAMNQCVRSQIYKTIFLSGGSAKFLGFRCRLQTEVNAILPEGMQCHILPVQYSEEVSDEYCWIGLSILGSLSNYKNAWISKQEYDETGPDIVNRRRFGP